MAGYDTDLSDDELYDRLVDRGALPQVANRLVASRDTRQADAAIDRLLVTNAAHG